MTQPQRPSDHPADAPLLLYATQAYNAMGDALAHLGGFVRGEVERRWFPDGERYLRLLTPVDRRDVALLAGTISDEDTLELYDLASAVVKGGARSLTLVVPYFGYSTMERALKRGEVVTGKTRARLLSSIPPAAFGNRILLVDLHTEGLTHYFEGHVRAFHLSALDVVGEAARRVGGEAFLLGCTDAGRAKWVEKLANHLGVDAAFVFKRRIDGERTEVVAQSGRVSGRRVVIYDDMVRTGSSLVNAARSYLDAGAEEVAAVVTHAILPGDALDRILSAGVLSSITCTDTHPRARLLESAGLQVETVVPLLAERLQGRL